MKEFAILITMGANYQAWDIKIDDFFKQTNDADRLRFLLNFAILAPSSHNSQPWKFEISDNKILISLEPSRLLPVGDANNRQAIISLGCAAQNILIAADYYGYNAQVNFIGEETLIAEITFDESGTKEDDPGHLIFSILKRVTNRNKYEDRPMPAELVEYMKSLETSNLKIDIITDQETKNKLADITLEAGIAAMDSPAFRLELSHHVKNNWTASPFGMPCFGLGIPTIISFFAPLMIRKMNMNKLNRKRDEALLKNDTPSFLIISTKNDETIDWFNTGLAFQKIVLLSTRLGVSISPWAAPIQIGKFYKRLQDILWIDTRPQLFFRMGYTNTVVYNSPRALISI